MAALLEAETGTAQPQSPQPDDARHQALGRICIWIAIAAAAVHAAYAFPWAGFLTVLYLFALLQLARAETCRKAFYPGLAVGLLIAVGRLAFLGRIFAGGAGALWLVYAVWIGLFVALARLCLRRTGPYWGALLIPFVWCGLEYFRSELYYLRFSWLNPAYAFADAPWQVPLRYAGMYGLGFLLVSVAAAAAFWWQKLVGSLATLLVGSGVIWLGGWLSAEQAQPHAAVTLHIAGTQMEFPTEGEVLIRLNDLVRKYPEADVVVLSECTFDGPVPDKVNEWCRKNRRYLIAGGKAPASGSNFYNTAFVVGPDGKTIFRQLKAVPIQFFKDGLAATEQRLWESPWGKIGICICYDLSYTRVTDQLIRLGAQALIVPTMDMMDWGEAQHALHARIAPVRAAEYGIPIFRLASSGISQCADRTGHVLATAPCPGDGAILTAQLALADASRLPLDRWLGPFAAGLTGILAVAFLVQTPRRSAHQLASPVPGCFL
jgi:apolipoprotein N-acyltransferase